MFKRVRKSKVIANLLVVWLLSVGGTSYAGLTSGLDVAADAISTKPGSCVILVRLKNTGATPLSNVKVQHWLWVSGPAYAAPTLVYSVPNQKITLAPGVAKTFDTGYALEGPWVDASYTVDYGNQIKETNESNNSMTKRLTCRKLSS